MRFLRCPKPNTVLIDWLNAGKYRELLFARDLLEYLSAVVLLELEARAFFPKDQRLVQQVARGFERARRIVVPTAADWRAGGELLRQRFGKQGRKFFAGTRT